MAGTKMTLRRYGNEVIYWFEQEIIVDQSFLDRNNGLYITLTHPYVTGTKLLDVYLNGQLLSEDGGYEGIDETTIRLDLGEYEADHPFAGQVVPLMVGDEIYIRTWKPEYRQGGGSGIDDLRFKRLEEEVINARKYKNGDIPSYRLDDRLDFIQQRAESKIMVFALSKVLLGVAKLGELRFPYDGQITEVYVSSSKVGSTRTVFQIEKCSQVDYDTTPLWTNIFSHDLVIEANEKSNNTSPTPYAVSLTKVDKSDHFRINVTELGADIAGVTIEVMVTI